MNEEEVAKIRKFIGDRQMQLTIKNVLKRAILRKKEHDVHILAAQTLAVQCLEEAWRELESYKVENKKETPVSNIGL